MTMPLVVTPKTKHKKLSGIVNLYHPRFCIDLAYMLEKCDYRVHAYLRWFWHTRDIGEVLRQHRLHASATALFLAALATLISFAIYGLAGWCVYAVRNGTLDGGYFLAAAIVISQPIITAHLILVPVLFGNIFLKRPLHAFFQRQAATIFKQYKGIAIVIAGSYGKTTMKEILNTVIGSTLKVAATQSEQNSSIDQARFARQLHGDEDVILVELGENHPGDIEKYCEVIHPNIAIITGAAPVHLEHFGTFEAATEDIVQVSKFVDPGNVMMNDENVALKSYIDERYKRYSRTSCLGWSIGGVKTNLSGTRFTMKKGKRSIPVKTQMLGKHIVGPTALTVAFALEHLKLSREIILAALKTQKPLPHRLEPTRLSNRIIVLDDLGNNSIEGVRATADFVKELRSKRKICVTPGLAEQGIANEAVHIDMGHILSDAYDEVILVENRETPYLEKGLVAGKFEGIIRKADDVKKAYEYCQQTAEKGDIVVLQNEWSNQYM